MIPTDPKFLYLPGLEMGGRWKLKIKLKSAKLELELGLSMEKLSVIWITFSFACTIMCVYNLVLSFQTNVTWSNLIILFS